MPEKHKRKFPIVAFLVFCIGITGLVLLTYTTACGTICGIMNDDPRICKTTWCFIRNGCEIPITDPDDVNKGYLFWLAECLGLGGMVLYTPIRELETWMYQDDSKQKEQGREKNQKEKRLKVPLYFKIGRAHV